MTNSNYLQPPLSDMQSNVDLTAAIKQQISASHLIPPVGLEYTEWLKLKASIAVKKNSVLDKVARIPKNGYNERFKYHFSSESDISDFMRAILVECGLSIDVTLLRSRKEKIEMTNSSSYITTVEVMFIWTDTETGFSTNHYWEGTGIDGQEKGHYKAYTGASKYFLLKEYLMSTGDDPEYEKKEEPQTSSAAQPYNARTANKPANTRPRTSKATEPKQEQPKDEPKSQPLPTEDKKEEPEINEPVGAMEVGEMKTRLLILSGYSAGDKEEARKATLVSIGDKLKREGFELTNCTKKEYPKVIEVLDGWIKLRKEKIDKIKKETERKIKERSEQENE